MDIGAYEFQSPTSILPYAWAQQYGLPTDGSADFVDTDGDGMSNYAEWLSDTIPTNALSALRMVSAIRNPNDVKVTWQSVSTRNYSLQRTSQLGDPSLFQTVAYNIAGAAGTTTYTQRFMGTPPTGPSFYRVSVQVKNPPTPPP
jgi:hypothetical protein